jgi:hypothetical protein
VEGQDAEGANGGLQPTTSRICHVIEFVWPDGRMVRFSDLDRFLEFMKRTA